MAKKKAAKKKNTARIPAARKNPPKLRRVGSAGTGWMAAKRVKIVKVRGKPAQVLIEKPRRKKR